MDVMLHLDGDPEIRENAHREHEITTLKARVKDLEYDCAELQKHNDTLSERVKKLSAFKPRPSFGKRKPFNANRPNYKNRAAD